MAQSGNKIGPSYEGHRIDFRGLGWYGLVTVSKEQQSGGTWFAEVCWKKFETVPAVPDDNLTPNGRLDLVWLSEKDVEHDRPYRD